MNERQQRRTRSSHAPDSSAESHHQGPAAVALGTAADAQVRRMAGMDPSIAGLIDPEARVPSVPEMSPEERAQHGRLLKQAVQTYIERLRNTTLAALVLTEEALKTHFIWKGRDQMWFKCRGEGSERMIGAALQMALGFLQPHLLQAGRAFARVEGMAEQLESARAMRGMGKPGLQLAGGGNEGEGLSPAALCAAIVQNITLQIDAQLKSFGETVSAVKEDNPALVADALSYEAVTNRIDPMASGSERTAIENQMIATILNCPMPDTTVLGVALANAALASLVDSAGTARETGDNAQDVMKGRIRDEVTLTSRQFLGAHP